MVNNDLNQQKPQVIRKSKSQKQDVFEKLKIKLLYGSQT